ncbi:MAG: hypothetical protein WD068_00540 [Candidatus Babeliales bacterium]
MNISLIVGGLFIFNALRMQDTGYERMQEFLAYPKKIFDTVINDCKKQHAQHRANQLLYAAILHSDHEGVKRALCQGADVNHEKGWSSCLANAVLFEDSVLIKILVAAGAEWDDFSCEHSKRRNLIDKEIVVSMPRVYQIDYYVRSGSVDALGAQLPLD